MLYLVSPFVDNPDLGARLSTTGSPPVPTTMRILRQVADALDVAHRAGLVHRAVRPGAILVDPGFEHAYLRDFGIPPETGGPDYVAPEQILGGPVDGRADMYALGAVLYLCLTGVAPYLRSDRAAVLAAHVHEGPPRVSEWRMDLPRGLDGVIAKAMAKNPADRFDSCGAMIAAATAVLGPGGAVPPPPPHQASGIRRPRRRWAVVGALVAAVVLIAGGLLVVPRILNRPTSDELARVPAAVRTDCDAAAADAAVLGAPRLLRCRDVAGQEVLIGLFDSAETASAAYRDRLVATADVATGEGDCADGPGREHVYPGVGAPAGRVLCGRDGSTTGLTWIDNPARTVAVAVRPDGNALELYLSWATWVQVPAFPAPPEQELLGLLPDTDCRRAPAGTLEGLDGVVAALECVPTDAGAGTVTYFRFADAESLRRSYAADVSEAGAPAGVNCVNEAAPEFLGDRTWDVRSGPLGRVLCRPDDGGRPSLTWTADPLLVLARAMGTDPAGLRTFWYSAYRPKLPEMVKVLNERAQPPFPSAEESALLARIPAASSVACLRPSSEVVRDHVGDAAVVGVACGTISGPSVFYYQYADPAALTAAIGGPARGPDCTTSPPDFSGAAQYTRPDGSTGTLVCGRNDAGNAVLDWTDDTKRIRALAFAGEPATLIAWWQTDAGPI